ncbi:hypothetical protein BKA70DRAFT_1473484 [Coprinopsis sp. MPI-PUGE-AT-0042]|nr:hypothetical protein BKA70DRAFT_1473484 [Coprinopsis sp. MPI-PUGE-AT-0042]
MAVEFKPTVTPAKKTTGLPVSFVVVGGGISGLSCAIALRRVGHRVTVLEKHADVFQPSIGGVRCAPNASKILFHWGLEKELRGIGMLSKGMNFHILDSGEYLGSHTWDEEVIRETRGEFLFSHHSDLRKLLLDTAISCGATVKFNAKVKAVDPTNKRVELSTGEVVEGDVIIGADGVNGLCRALLTEEEDEEPAHCNNVYSTVVVASDMLADKELEGLVSKSRKAMYGWFGNGRSTLLFPLGGSEDYALMVYSPVDGQEGSWDDRASLEGMQQVLDTAEPRVKKLAKLAAQPTCVPMKKYADLDDWVHESGRMLVIGEAVHPIPPGCIQEVAMAIEDGAVLAKLFSHLRTEDQIPSLLSAFQDLRTPRCDFVLKKELGDVSFMTLPPCEFQEGRDQMFRTKRDAGVGVLDSLEGSDEEELPQWAEIKELFGYDAEDDADNWWMEWGLLRERAKGTDLSNGFVAPAEIKVATGVSLASLSLSA